MEKTQAGLCFVPCLGYWIGVLEFEARAEMHLCVHINCSLCLILTKRKVAFDFSCKF